MGDHSASAQWMAAFSQLRVSLTDRCNLACWFCHNEGAAPPVALRGRQRPALERSPLDPDVLLAMIGEIMQAGVPRLFITGGEPLLARNARPIIEGLAAALAMGIPTTLITNGTLLERNVHWLARTRVSRIKVSLHYFSDRTMEAVAGSARFRAVIRGIEVARAHFPSVELNTLYQEQNEHEIRAIVDFARDSSLPLQIIELVPTAFNAGNSSRDRGSDRLVEYLRTLAKSEKVDMGGRGQHKRTFHVDDIDIELIDRRLGRQYVTACAACPLKPKCAEGVWALRLDALGVASPCLLRRDLSVDLGLLSTLGQPLWPGLSASMTGFVGADLQE